MSEKLIAALRTTAMGMGIVIFTLYVLSLILDFMKYLFKPEKKEITQKTHTQPHKITKMKEKHLKDEELVTVICAALNAYLKKPISPIRISIKQKEELKKESKNTNDEELVAVICAALNAYLKSPA